LTNITIYYRIIKYNYGLGDTYNTVDSDENVIYR